MRCTKVEYIPNVFQSNVGNNDDNSIYYMAEFRVQGLHNCTLNYYRAEVRMQGLHNCTLNYYTTEFRMQ